MVAALVGDNGRITLNWAVDQPFLPKPAVKVLLNLASIGIDALVRGGTLVIGAEQRGRHVRDRECAPQAQRIAFDENIGKALSGTPARKSSPAAPRLRT